MVRLKLERSFAMALMFMLVGTALAEPPDEKDKTVTIPLKEIWGNRMPGTRAIEKLVSERLFVYEIKRALGFPPQDKAKPAFAVEGAGLDALREAHAVLVDKKKSRDTFPTRNEVSVVFFTHETGPYVYLHKVERQGNNVNIYYRFVPHEEEETERYIALIPLGKLPSGKYRVNVIRSQMPQKYIDLGFRPTPDEVAQRIVCGSFSFSVSEQGE